MYPQYIPPSAPRHQPETGAAQTITVKQTGPSAGKEKLVREFGRWTSQNRANNRLICRIASDQIKQNEGCSCTTFASRLSFKVWRLKRIRPGEKYGVGRATSCRPRATLPRSKAPERRLNC